jgi:hypothetical protein
MLEGAGNILVTRDMLARMQPPWFDPQFALTGGEDKEFFLRLKAQGARFAWSAEAVSYTEVPATRGGLKWTLTRAYGNGNSDMRILLKHRRAAPAMAVEFAKIVAALIVSPLLALVWFASPPRRLGALRTFSRALGKLGALFGHRHQEYAVIHGQ